MKVDKETGVFYNQWCVPNPQAVLLLVHGLGGHSSRWEFLSHFFQKNRINSYAIELKGFGQTQDLRGHIDSFNIYFDDIRTLCAIITKESPEAKIFILGESLGALLAFLMAIFEPGLFSGLICLSPAFRSRLKFSFLDYIKVCMSLLVDPQKQFPVPFTAAMCTRDRHCQAMMDQDEREHRFASSRLLINILMAQLRVWFIKNKLSIPTLFLASGNDYLVDPKASIKVFEALKIEDKTIILYPEMYHALSIELDREKVFQDILQWVEGKLS